MTNDVRAWIDGQRRQGRRLYFGQRDGEVMIHPWLPAGPDRQFFNTRRAEITAELRREAVGGDRDATLADLIAIVERGDLEWPTPKPPKFGLPDTDTPDERIADLEVELARCREGR